MDGRLGRVNNEVSQREAEALRGTLQAQGLGSGPGEGLFLLPARGGRRGRLTLVPPVFPLGLGGKEDDRSGIGLFFITIITLNTGIRLQKKLFRSRNRANDFRKTRQTK